MLAESRANLRGRAITVVGQGLDDYGDAAGAITLIADILVIVALAAARAFLDGALDIVLGHVSRLGRHDGGAQPVIGVRIAAPQPCGHGELAAQLGE
jgi:hypothetical protein